MGGSGLTGRDMGESRIIDPPVFPINQVWSCGDLKSRGWIAILGLFRAICFYRVPVSRVLRLETARRLRIFFEGAHCPGTILGLFLDD